MSESKKTHKMSVFKHSSSKGQTNFSDKHWVQLHVNMCTPQTTIWKRPKSLFLRKQGGSWRIWVHITTGSLLYPAPTLKKCCWVVAWYLLIFLEFKGAFLYLALDNMPIMPFKDSTHSPLSHASICYDFPYLFFLLTTSPIFCFLSHNTSWHLLLFSQYLLLIFPQYNHCSTMTS